MCITRLHNFCINEGTEVFVLSTTFEDKQGGENEAINLDCKWVWDSRKFYAQEHHCKWIGLEWTGKTNF